MFDTGFTITPDEIRLDKDLGLTAAFIWGVVYRFCKMSRMVCDASHKTIADEAGVSKRSVDAYLPILVKKGYLIDKTPAIKHKPHEYDALPAAVRMGIVQPTEDKEVGVQNLHTSPDGMQELHTETPEGVQNLHSRYAKNAHRGVQNLQPIKTKITKQVNILPNGNGELSPPTKKGRKPSVRNLSLGELSREFTRITGIKEPSRSSDKKHWYGSLGEIYEISGRDIDIGKKLIEFTVKKLKGDELTVGDPNSLVKTARAVMAQREAQRQKKVTIDKDGGVYL